MEETEGKINLGWSPDDDMFSVGSAYISYTALMIPSPESEIGWIRAPTATMKKVTWSAVDERLPELTWGTTCSERW